MLDMGWLESEPVRILFYHDAEIDAESSAILV